MGHRANINLALGAQSEWQYTQWGGFYGPSLVARAIMAARCEADAGGSYSPGRVRAAVLHALASEPYECPWRVSPGEILPNVPTLTVDLATRTVRANVVDASMLDSEPASGEWDFVEFAAIVLGTENEHEAWSALASSRAQRLSLVR